MKGRRGVREFNLKYRGRTLILLCLSGCFLCGILAGCFWADSVAEREGAALLEYVTGYLAVLQEEHAKPGPLFSTFWDLYRWPLVTVLAAFTALGPVIIPAIFLVRGFLLSFATACFVRVLGSTGAILAFILFGISGMLSLPVLFILGAQGVISCRQLCLRLMGARSGTEKIYGNEYMIRCGLCMFLLLICFFLERLLVPALLTILASSF